MVMPATPAPGTMPPRKKRLADLTPREQEAALAAGFTVADDGTLSPPTGGPPPMQGGYSGAPGGAPGTMPASPVISPPGAMPGGRGMGNAGAPLNARIEGRIEGPFMDQQFDRHFATRDAPMPGTPGGVGGGPGPSENPMREPTPEPFEAPAVTPPLAVANEAAAPPRSGGDATEADQTRQMPGRLGRRASSRQTRPSGRPISSRRRR